MRTMTSRTCDEYLKPFIPLCPWRHRYFCTFNKRCFIWFLHWSVSNCCSYSWNRHRTGVTMSRTPIDIVWYFYKASYIHLCTSLCPYLIIMLHNNIFLIGCFGASIFDKRNEKSCFKLWRKLVPNLGALLLFY